MFGLNEVPDLSSDGVALKRFITREPPRKEVYGNVVNSNLENILLCSRETSSLQNIGNSLPRKQSSMFHARGPDKKNRPSEDVSPSKFISETLDKENYTEWLKQEDIARIANLQYGWHGEDNNIIFDIIGSLEQLESQLKEYQEGLKRPNKQSLTYIINLDNNHWVTLVITCYNQQFLAYYIDSFGRSIRENYKSLLEGKRIRTESFNVNQQKDVYNCGIFALENAKIINESIQSNEIDNLEKKLQDLGRELSTQQLMDIRQSFANLLKENSENLPSNCQLNDQMSILSSNELEEDHVIRMLVSFLGSNTQEKPSIDDFKIGTVAQDCLLDAIAQGLNELRSEGIIEHSSEFSTELLQQVCVAESGRDSNYEYEEYVKSPDPKMSDKSKVICDKYGVDFCVYSIQDNKIKADITRANIDEGIFFTSMGKDDEDFWIDYSKTIRIVQYNQYFVPFFSKNSRYIEAYDACTSKLAELLLDHPKEFNEKFNDVLKTISSLSSYEEQASKIYSVIDQVLAFFTELCEKVSIRKPGYSKILDDRGEVNIKIELSFVIKEGKEIIRVIDIIQQTEGLFANVSEELLYNEFNNQLDSRLEIRHTIPEIVITTDAYTSGNDDNAEDGAGGILSICNSVSVNSLDQKIMGELMQYKLNRLNIISIVQEESSIFRVKRLEFRRVPTGKEGNHILPVSTFFKCLASFFTMSKDFFEATDDLLSIFSQIKQNHKYSSYIEKSYKTLKEARDKKILCKEKLTVFLECGLIPFVFLAWNERDTSVYSQLKTQRRFGQEGAAVRFVNKKFESLLNDVPSSLESFQERIKEMQGEFFGVLDIPVIVRIDPADQKKLEQYSNDISKYLIRRIDTILNYPGNIIENYLLEQIEISISVSDSDEARKAFGEIQKLSNRKYSKKTYEKISSECTKIKGHLKDQQIREYLDTFEISQKFKCELKKFSSNIVKNVKGYNLLQYLDKVINFYQGEQDEEVIGKLSKLKLNLTIILQTLENFNSEAHHAKTGDINTIARDDLNIIVDSDLNELKSNLTIVLRVLKSLDSEARFKITEEIRNAIDIIAKDDLSAIIYDVRKLFQAWIYILELKKPHYLQKKEGYVQFLNSFFNKQHFLQELINNKIRIQDRLDKLRKIILQETDNQSELSFDYGTQASVTGRPGSYTKGIQDIQDIQDIQGTDDINNAYSIIKNNLKEGYDIYNESFIRIILEYSTYREFRVFIGTAGEEEILKTKATIKHETQNNTSDYLLIIKNEKNNFIKYVINGEEPKCLSINSNDDFIKAVIYTIKQDYGINLSPIAMIESVDHPIPPHRNIAMVQMHSPNYGQLHYSIAKHYLKYHRKIEISGESHQSCKRGCNSMLKEPFQDLYNKYLSRSINKKLVVKNAASDNHQFRLDQQAANKLVLDGNEKVTHTINEEIIDSKSVNKRSRISDGSTQKPLEKKASLDDPTRQNVDVEKSTGDHQKEDASYKQQNLSRKGSLDDGNNSKKQERGFKSTSDLPGNSNDCGSKGSSLHNSEKVLEEDLLLSPSNSNDGNDLHDSAQGFNEGLLLSPGDSDNESDLHHQAQNFNNESASGINFPVMIVPHVSSTPDAQVDSDDKSYDNLPGQNVEPEFISQNDEEKRNSLSGKEGSSKHGNTSEESTNEDRASSSTKRLRTSDGNTQKPPVKKVAQSDSPRQNVEEVKIEPSVGSNKSYGQQGSGQESSLNNGNNFQKQESDSEYGGTSEKSASRNLNNIQPNSENQEIFPRSPNASESSVEQENDLEQDDTIEERSEQSCNSKQYNSSRKEVINKGENIVNKRPRISDGSTQKPPEKKVTLDDSPSDLPGNNNDCGPKGSSSHNSEQALEEDQLLSFGDSNNGTDSHNLAQDFNKDLLLSSGNCDNKSDLYDQAQNFNSDNEGSTLSSPDEKRPCIGDEDTPKLPNVEEVEVESNVGNDKSYERQDSNRESGPEASDSWSKSKHPTLNDVSDESFGDEKSVCSSPEQNSGSSLEQASNSSERNDLQSNGNDSNSSESEKSSASSKSNVGNDESYEQQDSNRESGSEESCSRSSSPDSQEGEQLTLNDVESNGENQEAFSRSSSTSDKNDNNHLSEESESRSSIDARDNNGLQNVFLQEGDSYNKLGDNCCSINDIAKGAECYEKAIEYYEKAKALDSQNTSIIKVIGNSYNKLGDSYCSINDKAKGAECYKKTIEYYERVRKLDSRDMFITSIAHVSDKLGDIIEDEDEKAECYEKAMKYHGMAIDYLGVCSIDSLNDAASISMKLSDITKFMNKKDEYREISEKYYKRVDELKILEGLRLACDSRSRDWDAIKLFIDKIDNVNKLLNNEGTLLHLAATDGQREMVKYLLEKGANVTFGSKGGSTPLHKAAQKGHLDIVRMLLERNAAVNVVDHCGRTALHLAAQEGHLDVVEMLLKKGARSFLDQYNNTPLQLISKRLSQDPENDRLKEVQGFLSNFIENSDESSSVLSSSGSQEVEHTASNDISEKSFGDEKSVCSSPEQNSGSSLEQASNSSERNDLQSNGNDSNSSESEKSSASSKSNVGNDESYEQQDSNWRNGSEESDLQSSNLYSHKGSRPTLSDTSEKSSSTSIFAAVKNNNLDLIRKHIKEKVDVNDRNESGYAPLHLAAQNNFADAVMILIKAGAEVDLKAENNFCLSTPLHLAFRHKAMDSAKVLMENKADINAVNARQRKTYQELSFNYAKIIQYEEARSFLLDYKIDLSDSENGDCIERIKLSDEESFNDELGEESSSSHDSHGAIEFHGTNDQDAQSSQQQEPNTRTTSSQQQESSAQVANDSSMPPMFRSRSSDQHLQDVEQNDHIPLHVAAQNGHLNVVEALLGGGTSVDVGSFLKKQHLNALNIEMRLPKTTLNSVALDNHLRRRSASF